MESVAHHLQVQALSRHKDGADSDFFARSAYNRYYYAMFLCVRETMSELDVNWSRLAHADYPKTLEGQVAKMISGGRKRAIRIGDTKLVARCQRAASATKLLAKLMRESSAVRVVADYEPTIRIDFTAAERFNLSGVEITTAHQWPSQARVFTETIASTWKQINA